LEKSLRGYVLIYYFAYNICRCEYQKKSYSWRFWLLPFSYSTILLCFSCSLKFFAYFCCWNI